MPRCISKIGVSIFLGMAVIPAFGSTERAETGAKTVVSRVVKNAAGKSYIEVDGRPFLYNSVQSWYPPEKDYSLYVQKAAKAGYKCFTFWLYWQHLEPNEGQYDFSELDKVIDLANKYDLRLDIVWGGTNFCGHLDPRFGPLWLLNNHSYHLRNPNGGCHIFDGFDMGMCCATDPTNKQIFEKENNLFKVMLAHLKAYDKNHRVIAIQIENEANIHNWPGGKGNVLAYINALGKTVKESDYTLVTRVNLVFKSMDRDVDALEYIDGHGPDPYDPNVTLIRNIITGPNNTKLRYIAENAAYENSTSLIVAALANGGFYNIYRLDYDGVWNKPGVYDKNFKDWRVTKQIRNLNTALNKIGSLIAESPKEKMLEFNTDANYPSGRYKATKSLSGRTIGFKSRNASKPVGLVVEKDGSFYCVADKKAYFTFDVQPAVCQTGFIDDSGKWIKTADKSFKKRSDAEYQVKYDVGQCIRFCK
jgi:hypothetical protein